MVAPAKMTAAKARQYADAARRKGEPQKIAAWEAYAAKLQAEEADGWRNRADLT